MRTIALIGELIDLIFFGIILNKWLWIGGAFGYLIYKSRNG